MERHWSCADIMRLSVSAFNPLLRSHWCVSCLGKVIEWNKELSYIRTAFHPIFKSIHNIIGAKLNFFKNICLFWTKFGQNIPDMMWNIAAKSFISMLLQFSQKNRFYFVSRFLALAKTQKFSIGPYFMHPTIYTLLVLLFGFHSSCMKLTIFDI